MSLRFAFISSITLSPSILHLPFALPNRAFEPLYPSFHRRVTFHTPPPSHPLIMVAPSAQGVWRVVITRRMPDSAMQKMRAANLLLDTWDSDEPMPHATLIERIGGGCEAIYCVLSDRIDAAVLDAAGERLRIVSTMSVGFNHIDVSECKRRSILVSHTPNVLTDTTADTAVALVLAAARRFKEATASVINGTWGAWTPMGMCGQDVHHATVGIVGMGRIGSAVAKRLYGFDCKILYWGIERVPKLEKDVGARFVELDELLSDSDIVIPLCPLVKETYEMFDMSKFRAMKKSAVFVNPARGELVKQDDLVEALKTGEIFSAGLDVTTPEPLPKEHELVKLDNCFILPHIASASRGTRTAMALLAAENVVAAYKGESLPSEL